MGNPLLNFPLLIANGTEPVEELVSTRYRYSGQDLLLAISVNNLEAVSYLPFQCPTGQELTF